jgi:hypothetical protein
VVGASCPDTPLCKPGAEPPSRAFQWQHGVMMDMNALVVGEPRMYLLNALAMNEAGQIVGIGLTPEFEVHAFLATPVSGHGHGATLPSRVAPQLSAIALGARPRQGRYRGLRDR